MTVHDPVVIVGAARTAMGDFLGVLSSIAAPALGAAAIAAGILPGRANLSRRAHLYQIYEGISDMQRMVIARNL